MRWSVAVAVSLFGLPPAASAQAAPSQGGLVARRDFVPTPDNPAARPVPRRCRSR
jgi:hypothetical protein